MGGDSISLTDPTTARFERRRDPNNPGHDIITVKPTAGMKGYLTVHAGGEKTHINIRNDHPNTHLQAVANNGHTDHSTFLDSKALTDASVSASTALAERRARFEKIQMPAEGTELNRCGNLTIDAGQETVWFRYQGQTYRLSPNSKPITIGDVTFSRKNGILNIDLGENAKPGELALRVGDAERTYGHVRRLVVEKHPQTLSLSQPERNTSATDNPGINLVNDPVKDRELKAVEIVPISKDHAAMPFTTPFNGPLEVERDGDKLDISKLPGIVIKKISDRISVFEANYADGSDLKSGEYAIWQGAGNDRKCVARYSVQR